MESKAAWIYKTPEVPADMTSMCYASADCCSMCHSLGEMTQQTSDIIRKICSFKTAFYCPRDWSIPHLCSVLLDLYDIVTLFWHYSRVYWVTINDSEHSPPLFRGFVCIPRNHKFYILWYLCLSTAVIRWAVRGGIGMLALCQKSVCSNDCNCCTCCSHGLGGKAWAEGSTSSQWTMTDLNPLEWFKGAFKCQNRPWQFNPGGNMNDLFWCSHLCTYEGPFTKHSTWATRGPALNLWQLWEQAEPALLPFALGCLPVCLYST